MSRHLCCGDASHVAVLTKLGLSAAMGVPGGLEGATVTIGGKSARTDAQGRFLITGLAAGIYPVTLSHAIYNPSDVWAPKPRPSVAVRPNQKTSASFSMFPPYASLAGRLLDAVTGKPIIDPLVNGIPIPAYVYVPDNAGVHGDVFDVADSADRRFSIAVLAGSREVRVAAPGYKPFSIRLSLANGQTANQDLRLQPLGATVRGTVKDAMTAQRVAGASVQIGSGRATTNSNGEFTAADVTPHQSIVVRVTRNGYHDTLAETVVVPGQSREKDIVVVGTGDTAWQEVSGTVTDKATQKPIAGVSVEIGGRRVCTDGTGRYQLRTGPTRPGMADPIVIQFVRKAYKTEARTVELRHVAEQTSQGSAAVNRHDAALVPDAASMTYQAGCVPTIAVQDTAGPFTQQLTLTVTDQATGRPVPRVAVTGMQPTNRAQPFRVCTDDRGVAVLRDVSMTVGAEAGQVIQNLTLHRNGYAPRVEREVYTTFGARNLILTITPNAAYQSFGECSDPG